MEIISFIDGILPALFSKISSQVVDRIMVFITSLGDGGFIWFILIASMLVSKKHRRAGVVSLVALGVCFFFGSFALKPLFARVRPCNIQPGIALLIDHPSDFSFPSMHTATSFSVAVMLYCYDRKIGIPAIVLASLIALSRVYLNVHYTTDIIAGAILGTAFALLFYYLFFKLGRKDNNA